MPVQNKQELEVSFVTLLASFPGPFKFGLSSLVSRASPFSVRKETIRESLSGDEPIMYILHKILAWELALGTQGLGPDWLPPSCKRGIIFLLFWEWPPPGLLGSHLSWNWRKFNDLPYWVIMIELTSVLAWHLPSWMWIKILLLCIHPFQPTTTVFHGATDSRQFISVDSWPGPSVPPCSLWHLLHLDITKQLLSRWAHWRTMPHPSAVCQ